MTEDNSAMNALIRHKAGRPAPEPEPEEENPAPADPKDRPLSMNEILRGHRDPAPEPEVAGGLVCRG